MSWAWTGVDLESSSAQKHSIELIRPRSHVVRKLRWRWLAVPRLSNERQIEMSWDGHQECDVKINLSIAACCKAHTECGEYHSDLVMYIAPKNRSHWKECGLIKPSEPGLMYVFQECRLTCRPQYLPTSSSCFRQDYHAYSGVRLSWLNLSLA